MESGLRTDLLYGCWRLHVQWVDEFGAIRTSVRGTGFIVESPSATPVVVTNRHVLDPAYRDRKKEFWSLGAIELFGARHENRTALVRHEVMAGCRIAFGPAATDIAVLDLRCNDWWGEITADGDRRPIANYFGVDWLAHASEFDGVRIATGDPVYMIGYPVLGQDQSHMPLLADGVLSSDPRLDYPLPIPDGSGAASYEPVLMLHSSSRSGMSGAPVIVPWRDQAQRPPRIIGVNAGHIPASKDVGPSSFTYAYRSDHILEAIAALATAR